MRLGRLCATCKLLAWSVSDERCICLGVSSVWCPCVHGCLRLRRWLMSPRVGPFLPPLPARRLGFPPLGCLPPAIKLPCLGIDRGAALLNLDLGRAAEPCSRTRCRSGRRSTSPFAPSPLKPKQGTPSCPHVSSHPGVAASPIRYSRFSKFSLCRYSTKI